MKSRLIETIDDFNPKFLWYPYIPFETPSVFQGQAGFGKTTIICRIMAELSNGIYPPRLIHGTIKDRTEVTEWERYAVDSDSYWQERQEIEAEIGNGNRTKNEADAVSEAKFENENENTASTISTITTHLGISVEGIDDEDLEAREKNAPPMNMPFRRPLGEPVKMVYISRENKYGYIKKRYRTFRGQDGFLRIIEEDDGLFTTSQAKIRELLGDAKFAVIDPIFPLIDGSLLNNEDTAMMMHNFEVVASETGGGISASQ